MRNIKSTDRICINCRYVRNGIALGLGLRCQHPEVMGETKKPQLVPSRFHTCKLYETTIKGVNF